MDLERLDTMVAEGRIIRNAWSGKTDDGRETACLFSALYPGATTTAGCPATDMPQWLADLTPCLDDKVSLAAWPVVVRRYAGLARRWHVLDAAGWRRALLRSLAAILAEARTHAGASTEVVDAVAALIGRELAGDPPTIEEWTAAAEAARAEAWTVVAAAEAARAEAWTVVAEAARAAAAEAARAEAWTVVAAAARAAEAWTVVAAEARAAEARAAEAWTVVVARAEAAAAAAWDRMATGILDAIETECASKEGT